MAGGGVAGVVSPRMTGAAVTMLSYRYSVRARLHARHDSEPTTRGFQTHDSTGISQRYIHALVVGWINAGNTSLYYTTTTTITTTIRYYRTKPPLRTIDLDTCIYIYIPATTTTHTCRIFDSCVCLWVCVVKRCRNVAPGRPRVIRRVEITTTTTTTTVVVLLLLLLLLLIQYNNHNT